MSSSVSGRASVAIVSAVLDQHVISHQSHWAERSSSCRGDADLVKIWVSSPSVKEFLLGDFEWSVK